MNRNYLFCGVGGQGTVLASKVIAAAAICQGEEVKTTETIGMAQRGGSVVSHVRTGHDLHSPILPYHSADLMMGFEPGEAVRNLKYLKKDGTVVVLKKPIQPVTASVGISNYDGEQMLVVLKKSVSNVIVIDGEAICEKCHSEKVLNVALLGAAAASGQLEAGESAILAALKKQLPKKVIEINELAFELGKQEYKKNL